jgi:hypothetical protein
VALLSAWILVTLLIFANRILWLLIGGGTCTIVGLLAGLDIADGGWTVLGLRYPIVVLTLVVVAVLVIAMRRFRQKGMNVLAIILLGAAIFIAGSGYDYQLQQDRYNRSKMVDHCPARPCSSLRFPLLPALQAQEDF